ncbi:MAG: MOSC domain-containing protein [Agarilytica sp.]
MFRSKSELEAGVEHIQRSPKNEGDIAMIVCRPGVGKRKVLQDAALDLHEGLVGDNWLTRGFKKSPDGSAHPDMQLNIMNARSVELIAGAKERWPLAGDQFYVDLDLSPENLPPGTKLKMGDAEIIITAEPHLGCKKFSERFGRDASMFVNSDLGKALNLRGVNAKVTQPGNVNAGDRIRKI